MELSTDILAELKSCRLLLEMLAGRMTGLESRLFPQWNAEGMGDSHVFQQGEIEGKREYHSFPQPNGEGTGGSHPFPQPACEEMSGAHATAEALYQLLKKGEYKGRSGKTLHYISTFLCHLQISPTGNSHTVISKLTGMSGSGVGKMLMALHRRGFIQKEGWQHYNLTEKALNIVRQAALSAQ